MLRDEPLTSHFYLSQLIANPVMARAGLRNEPMSAQVANLRRTAQALEVVRAMLAGADVHVLRGYRQVAVVGSGDEAEGDGRSVDFIAPRFGTPREICAHLIAQGLVFDRLVAAPQWVQLDIPRHAQEPRRILQTGVFMPFSSMTYLEGLL